VIAQLDGPAEISQCLLAVAEQAVDSADPVGAVAIYLLFRRPAEDEGVDLVTLAGRSVEERGQKFRDEFAGPAA
jgi:hypothetical protein